MASQPPYILLRASGYINGRKEQKLSRGHSVPEHPALIRDPGADNYILSPTQRFAQTVARTEDFAGCSLLKMKRYIWANKPS